LAARVQARELPFALRRAFWERLPPRHGATGTSARRIDEANCSPRSTGSKAPMTAQAA
jgi:hypothetical protein